MNYKDVCGGEEIRFVLSDRQKEGRLFFRFAKELGCVWISGKEIDPDAGSDFFVISMDPDGTIAYVPARMLAAKQYEAVKKVNFADFCKALTERKNQ